MNGTQRKAKSRIAEKLGLVAAPRGYVTEYRLKTINQWIDEAESLIQAEKEKK